MNNLNNKNICYSCEYGRIACATNKVACGFIFKEHKINYDKTMDELNLNNLNTGWGI